MQELVGVTISRYIIQRYLARGGMSEIYLACDTQTDQMVAIKLVNSNNEEYCQRFQREIYAVSRLKHPHILPVLDCGEYYGWCYMVTPYIKYGTLNERLARGPLTLEEAGQILAQLSSALQFVHERGIVHRDIKPSNILLRDDHYVYLADFGLVKGLDEGHDLTQSGFVIGTPDYLAPELVEDQVGIASDVYALGVLLYHMLTGRVPFRGETPVAVVWKHLQEQPELPSTLNPLLSHAVEQVILCALAKDPQERFQSVRDFAQAYQQALGLEDSTVCLASAASSVTHPVAPAMIATPDKIVDLAAGKVKRSPAFVLLAALMALTAPLLLSFFLFTVQNQAASPDLPAVQVLDIGKLFSVPPPSPPPPKVRSVVPTKQPLTHEPTSAPATPRMGPLPPHIQDRDDEDNHHHDD